MNSCADWSDAISQALDGDLDDERAVALRAHLADCLGCRSALVAEVRAHRLLLEAGLATVVRPARASRQGRHRTGWRPPARRRTSPLPWVATAVAVAAVLAVLLLFAGSGPALSPPGSASLAHLVDVSGAMIDGKEAGSGASLAPASRISCPSGGGATIVLADDSRLTLTGGTEAVLRAGERLRSGATAGELLDLDHGRVSVVASHRPADQPLAIRTPRAEAVVVGTRFTLTHRDGVSDLAVGEGVVRFTADGMPGRDVAAGQRASSRSQTATTATAMVCSFIAEATAFEAPVDGPIVRWRGTGGTAVPSPGRGGPIARRINVGVAACCDGKTHALTADLGAVDGTQGLTMLLLAIPRETGSNQRMCALVEDGREVLALLRSGQGSYHLDAAIDGSARAGLDSRSPGVAMAVRWHAGGRLDLLVNGTWTAVDASPPARLARAMLQLAGPGAGKLFDGDVVAVELYSGELADAAITAHLHELEVRTRFVQMGGQ